MRRYIVVVVIMYFFRIWSQLPFLFSFLTVPSLWFFRAIVVIMNEYGAHSIWMSIVFLFSSFVCGERGRRRGEL